MVKKIIYFTIFLFFIIFCIIFFINSKTQKGTIYIIPKGYKGKLSIVYNQKNKPTLEEKDGYQVVQFPLSGIVKTSSHPRTGKQHDKYFYYTKDKKIFPMNNIKFGGGQSIEVNGSYLFQFWIED